MRGTTGGAVLLIWTMLACRAPAPPVPPAPPEVERAGDARVDAPRVEPARIPTPASFDGTVGDTRIDREAEGVATLTEVRVGEHPGFDRVVFDFDGPVPGYRIAYVDRPVRDCGSGEVREVAGDGWLQIELLPARAHTEEGQATVTERSRRVDQPNLLQLEATCDFEAHVTWVLGLRSPTPYRVLELENPPRLVLDVAHP